MKTDQKYHESSHASGFSWTICFCFSETMAPPCFWNATFSFCERRSLRKKLGESDHLKKCILGRKFKYHSHGLSQEFPGMIWKPPQKNHRFGLQKKRSFLIRHSEANFVWTNNRIYISNCATSFILNVKKSLFAWWKCHIFPYFSTNRLNKSTLPETN